MNLISFDLLWLVLILITLNFVSAAFIRTEERYWLPQIILWMILFGFFLFSNTMHREQVVQKEMIYQQQTDPDDKAYTKATLELEQAKKDRQNENRLMIRLLGIQSLFAMTFQLFGYRQTSKKQFRSGAKTFFFLFFAYLVFELVWFLNWSGSFSNQLPGAHSNKKAPSVEGALNRYFNN